MVKFRCLSCWTSYPARCLRGKDGKTHLEALGADGSWVLVKWRTDWSLPCPLCASDLVHKRLRSHFLVKGIHPQSLFQMPPERRTYLRRIGREKLCRIIRGVACPGVPAAGAMPDDVESNDALDDSPDSPEEEERGEPRFR